MKPSSTATWALAVLLFGVTLAVAVASTGPEGGGLAGPAAELRVRLDVAEADVEALTRRLRAESAVNARLAAEVEGLRQELGAVAASRGDAAVDSRAPGVRTAREHPKLRVPRLDAEALAAVGFDPREVEWLRARLGEIELRRLHTRDRAAREGWLESPRFEREERSRAADLVRMREEVGEELYDWLLYSSGQPNRVRVSGTLSGSPADAAGLEPGDLIVAYDHDRVLRVDDLRGRTLSGVAGESVARDVARDGDAMRLYVPRGPLGVRVHPLAHEPARRR